MKTYKVTYDYTDEDNRTEIREIRVSAENKTAAKKLFLDSVRAGDEDVWGETWGSPPRHYSGATYYVVGTPEKKGWEPPVKMIRFVSAKPISLPKPNPNVAAAKRRAMQG